MDGKGRALDNVFVERLCGGRSNMRTSDCGSVAGCRDGLAAFFDRYNTRREHQALSYRYPKGVYLEGVRNLKAA
jgi:putative transposase